MRKPGFWIVLLALMASFSLAAQSDDDLPARPVPPRLVNDLAEVLSATEEAQLEQKLVAYNDSTSSQIAVITVRSVQPYVIDDYAYKLGRKWGVGQKEKDNGIVFLVATDDRAVFIATGYGVEGYLPDIAIGRIIDQQVLPGFRSGSYYTGIDNGVDEMFKYLTGAYTADPNALPEGPNVLVVIIIVIVILIILSRRNKKGGGTTFSRRGPTHWGGGGFGGFGGGFGGGGGGFGGGFGGFGGGGFGGGGAGGRW